jgi:hypothetical protein
MDGRGLTLAPRMRTPGLVDTSVVMAWNQATTRASGGLSIRETRRAGTMHETDEGKSRCRATGWARLWVESVAILSWGPTDDELGRPGSPHGAEFTHGPASVSPSCETGSESKERDAAPAGPQQQDEPRHFVRHLQC